MPVEKLKKYLDGRNVKYVTIIHSSAYTAQEVAASAHISGEDLAKTVMVKMDGKIAMAVLPASYIVDLELLKQEAGARQVELAGEQEFRSLFPECETGAMPPFGNLYDVDTFVDRRLTNDEEIAFNAGSHTELIKLSYSDFEKLAEPRVLNFSTSAHTQAKASGR
jgi:Ala-tRNA(Pro) deacylase